MASEETVEDFLEGLPAWQREIGQEARRIILEQAPEFKEGIKWSQPVYELGAPVCYLQAHSGHLNIGFWRGVELSDPVGLLEGSGKKMRHLKIRQGETVPEDALKQLLAEAIRLDSA